MRALIVLLLSCLCASAQFTLDGPGAGVFGQQKAAGGVCPADGSASLATTGGSLWIGIGSGASTYYAGQIWNDGGTPRTICKVGFQLKTVGDISGKTFTAYIFSSNGTDITSTTPLATSGSVTGDNAWNGGFVRFTFSSPFTTTGSANYVIAISQGGVDAANYALFYTTSDQIADHVDTFNSAGACQVVCSPGGTDMGIEIYWQ